MIDFYDNQPCIDLIETKLGILDLLDEECRMPKGTDQSWCEKLYSKCSKYKHFVRPRFGTSAFLIHHFADNVQYESSGFLEKNRDTVIEEQISVLRNSENKLVRKLFAEESSRKLSVPNARVKVGPVKTVPSSQKEHKKTVGSQFRDSLNALMSTLNATTPHYVRCIKPNDSKQAFEYNPQRAVQQLRACGVLETVRISAAGFPSRWFYEDFFQRYRVLCRFKDINRTDMKQTCERILALNIKGQDKYQFGKSKIFFRAGQVAYLEKLRAEKLKKCCIIVQSQLRAFLWRKKYIKLKYSVMNIQRYCRGYLARQRANEIRRNRSAVTLQRYIRGWIKRVQYARLRNCMIGLQARARGLLARKRFMEAKYNAKAIVIQRYVRGWLARRHYQKQKKRIIICQAAIRRFLARRLYKKLKIEARSVEHVKQLNRGLENKIISLQQRIEEINKENHQLKNAQNELNNLKIKVESLKGLEIETKKLNALIIEKDKRYKILETELQKERDEKMDLVEEQEKYKIMSEKNQKTWMEENEKLKKELDNLTALVKTSQLGAEEDMKKRIQQEKLLLINEQEEERNAYQRLLRDFNTLEQHCESLEAQMARYARNGVGPGATGSKHTRNLSDVSNLSNTETTSDISGVSTVELNDDDYGYGSVRSNSSTVASSAHSRLDTIDWRRTETSSPELGGKNNALESNVDVGLVLKLQQKLKEVENERSKLQRQLERLERDSPDENDEQARALDMIRLGELEVENSRLKGSIEQLRASVTEKAVMDQFAALQEELDRRREECIQLRSVLANQTVDLRSIASAKYGSDIETINEDGELALAYEAQKKINQQLEVEFQKEKARYKEQEEEYKAELNKLRGDNERQQKLISVNLTKSPATQTEAYMQHEIERLTSENLDLNEKHDAVAEQCRKYRKQARLLAKKLKDAGLLDSTLDPDAQNKEIKTAMVGNEMKQNLPAVRKKERDYQGMFEYKKEDETTIIKHMINDLKPRIAVTLLPGLPAYIMFMCIRHTDFINDDEKVRSLLTSFINGIKKVIKKRHEDIETTVLWLSNTLRLLHNLKQYSGDKSFQTANTPRQNEQCLRNFDLSEYRQVLSDIAVWIYQGIIRNMEEKVHPLVVPAILEHEAITNIGGNKPSCVRGRSASVGRDLEVAVPPQKAPQALVQELTNFYKILGFYGVDPELISQVFRQLFFFLCASALNNLLLRKELCHWAKGCQIRYNLSNLEMWARDKRLDEPQILEQVQPIIQAAQLLQARKTAEDVTSVCEMCSKLTAAQICKLLQLYTPIDDYEERVPTSFIRAVQAKLREMKRGPENNEEEGKLLMDVKFNFPVRFPFNPSTICLEDIDIPDVLNLPMLKKV